ncbi:unnamed protein product [Mytilus coruscus]|uniref:Uncharacterized protein n=1 Tax=Mytilus coruscus TaxID=42192 RepID=A0A6J8DI46_MYTCO|nr:unnamed protein product [Mytilus coruscus]
MAKNYAFTKKLSMKGNMEMRTNFGIQKAVVLTNVKGNFYINLYNNSKANPGRCSMSYAELEELITIKGIMDTLKAQMVELSTPTPPQSPQQSYNPQQDRQLMPPPPTAPYMVQPITVLRQCNKRPSAAVGGPPAKVQKLDGAENCDPMDFFTQLQ